MSKVTSKLQITLPKAVAAQYHIEPGDEIAFVPAGDVVRLETRSSAKPLGLQARLDLFDKATARLRQADTADASTSVARGWTREELYHRGRSR